MNKSEKDFIKSILATRDYWLSLNEDKEETLNGFIFSLLVMIDGDSAQNKCTPINLINCKTNKVINNSGCPLHELLYETIREHEKERGSYSEQR